MNTLPSRDISKNKRSSLLSAGFAFLIYAVLSFIFFGFTGSWTQYFRGDIGDPVAAVWALNWWPFALTHGLNPFISGYLWAPHELNLALPTTIGIASFLGLPFTLISGPVLAYNVLTIMAPALSAWTTFFLARYLTRNWWAALVGGYLFGFSSYMLGQFEGHLNLYFTCLVPLAVLLCFQRIKGDLGRLGFIVSLVLIMLAELGLSTEILATSCVFGTITWLVTLIFASRSDRSKLWALAIDILISAIIMMALAAPFLFYLFKGLKEAPEIINSTIMFSADPLNYFIPTIVTHFGRSVFSSMADKFTGNAAEQGAYLGLPLIFLMALYFRDHITRYYARVLLCITCILVVCSLGAWLHIGGWSTHIPLPWILADRLPLIRSALPTRFTMYVALCSAIVASLYLAEPNIGRSRIWRFALAGLACLFLVPNRVVFNWSPWPTQAFFSPTNIHKMLGPKANVLILPYGDSGPALAWQVNSGMSFTLSGGRFGFTPVSESRWDQGILYDLIHNVVSPNFSDELVEFCSAHRVDYILIGPGTSQNLEAAIEALNWPQYIDKGIRVVRVPPISKLNYSYIKGDFWVEDYSSLSWMGKEVLIHTGESPEVLTLSGTVRPVQSPVVITLTGSSGGTDYTITQSTVQTIQLPADITVKLTASDTFVPEDTLHNGDRRHLSVLISLRDQKTDSGSN